MQRNEPIRDSERGSALAAAMILLGAMAPVAAFVVMQARTDLLLQHNVRRAMETFYAAESGLEHALADLSLDPRFERLVADAAFPFRIEPPAFFPRPPYRYAVTVKRRRSDEVDVVARGIGSRGAVRRVAAVVARSPSLYLPAALFTAANRPHVLVDGRIELVGLPPNGRETGVPPVAAPTEEKTQHLTDQFARGARRGDPPVVAVRDFPILERLVAEAVAFEGANRIAGAVRGALGTGIHVSSAALELTNTSGSGLLLVDGALTVRSGFDFSGLVVALGDLRFDRDSIVQIEGSLLQGPAGGLLHLQGSGEIAYDEEAIRRLDRLLPGLLPHRAVVTGRRELG